MACPYVQTAGRGRRNQSRRSRTRHSRTRHSRTRHSRTRRSRTRRSKSHRKRKKQRGGNCNSCQTPQTGGSALINAIVPASILFALSRFTKTNKHRTKKSRKSRKRSR